MTQILVRCDASLSIGSGHVMRCRTLARELQRRGATVTFLCRRQPGDLIDLLEMEFPVLALPKQPLARCQGLGGRGLYAAWLGCSQAQDAVQCLEALANAGLTTTSWLVVDHYGLDTSWEDALLEGLSGEAPPKLLVIDDLADRPHQADLLLDQNFFGSETEQRYRGLLPAHCRQLLGLHYALLGPEYALLHPLVPPRTELRRVLVYFGGVDPDNLTGQSLEALMDSELLDLAVDVVLGIQSPNREGVLQLLHQRPNTTLHKPLPSLAGLITRADVAIGAGGATTWERLSLKLPSIVIPTAENQRPFSESLSNLGQIQYLADSTGPNIRKLGPLLKDFVRDPVLFAQHALMQIGMVDGKGARRLCDEIMNPTQPVFPILY